MKRFLSIICASTIALTGIAATSAPSIAAPALARSVDVGTTNANVVDVQYRGDRWDRRQERRWDRQERRIERRLDRRDARRGFYRDRGYSYYNGHRGYRDRRAGYRQHNGYWFPAAAFIAGAIVGGAVSQPAPPQRVIVRPGRLSQAHVDWCYGQYRSYRASDNTFQPYNGPRRACSSPYG
ncbi:BA14K family protein [Aliihoeflea sp. PC F10.4]